MSEKLDSDKCLCYLAVKNGQLVNLGKWGQAVDASGFSISNKYSFCKEQCIKAAGAYTFNFPDNNEFAFQSIDDWTISFYVLKEHHGDRAYLIWGAYASYSIQLADVNAPYSVGARIAHNYLRIGTVYNTDQKYHVAFVHTASDNTFRLYLDGKLKSTYQSTSAFYINKTLGVYNNQYALGDGFYIDELIITPQALWTEEFTPTYKYLWFPPKKIYLTCDNQAYART